MAPQLFQFFRTQRVAQHLVRIAPGIEAGAQMRMQDDRPQAVPPQHLSKDLHRGAAKRDVAQDQRMRADVAGFVQQTLRGFLGKAAVEQRCAQRAVGARTCQSGQEDLAGAPQGDDRQKASQRGLFIGHEGGVAPRAQRPNAGAAACGGVHGQFPGRQIVTVWFNRAFGKRAPLLDRNGRQRHKSGALQILCRNGNGARVLIPTIHGRARQTCNVSHFSHFFRSQR